MVCCYEYFVCRELILIKFGRYGLGMVYYRTNKIDLAQWHFRKAIEINPTNAVLICCEGMVSVSYWGLSSQYGLNHHR